MTEKHEVGCPCHLGGTSVLFISTEVAVYVAICLQVYSTGAAGDLGSILGQEDLLEEGVATLSSILAWRIPRTEEPGGPQSMGLQRVGMTERLTLT